MPPEHAVRALAALAQPTRLAVFRALVVAGEGGLTPGAVLERLALAPATLSFHLGTLLRAELVAQQRRGRQLHYHADFARMDALLGYLTEQCCGGEWCRAQRPSVAAAHTRRRVSRTPAKALPR